MEEARAFYATAHSKATRLPRPRIRDIKGLNERTEQHPQQHPAAAASSPTESDLWEAAFSSDDPTVVLTDEELNAARHAHEKARKSSSSAQSSGCNRPLTGAATATQPTLSPMPLIKVQSPALTSASRR